MSIDTVKKYFETFGIQDKILEFETSSATVDLAAQALNVIPARIAKTLSFQSEDGAILIVTAGDVKIDNHKFKEFFGLKAKMLSPEEAFEYTGHYVGGVCPFAINSSNVKIYTDISLQRFTTIFPACGSSNSAIELTCKELFEYSNSSAWIDVCKPKEE